MPVTWNNGKKHLRAADKMSRWAYQVEGVKEGIAGYRKRESAIRRKAEKGARRHDNNDD